MNLIYKYNLQKNFKIIIEFTPYKEIPKYMAIADIFVLPSISEGLGVVILEAMACGVPVIAYPNGAVPEVVENKKTGFIVKNVKEMTKAIKNINTIDRKKCRERVEKYFTVKKMVDEYEKLIKKIL